MPTYILNDSWRMMFRTRQAAWMTLRLVGLSTILFWFSGCAVHPAKPNADNSAAANDALVSPAMCPVLVDNCSAALPSYMETIAPIIEARCTSCHTGIGTAPWPLDTWENLAEWADLVTTSVDGCTMPPQDAGVPFTAGEREQLRTWLLCGAPNN